MKTIKTLTLTFLIFTIFSCTRDEVRNEQSGILTVISGNVKDYHRNLNISDFEVKLVKIWSCGVTGNLSPKTCEKVITKTKTDTNGNYILDFDYNLRSDEQYRIVLNQNGSNSYYTEYADTNNSFYSNYDTNNLVKGQTNVIKINAWIPIKIKFNLTVLNNNNPPLTTGIQFNNKFDFGLQNTYTNENTFEIKTRPNSNVKIKFCYILNYNSNKPIFRYAPGINYFTNENYVTELNYILNCDEF